jgi:RIO-like serine/threonine protein kinase
MSIHVIKKWEINRVSEVWKDGEYVYKKQPKYLTDNEWWMLDNLFYLGFTPVARKTSLEVIRMEYLQPEPVTNADDFRSNCELFLSSISNLGIRHGDLTAPHIFVRNNSPIVIDWSESRFTCDPRPDKRREGDIYWMRKSMEEVIARGT